MGNVVFAAGSEKDSSSMGTLPPPPPMTVAPTSPPTEAPKDEPSSERGNPGAYDDIHKKAKELFPQPLSGGKIAITKGVSPHFSTTHTLTLDQQQPSTYAFSATYVGANQTGPGESYPVILGEMDSSGILNSQFINQWVDGLKSKIIIQSNLGRWQGFQGDLEYRGSTYTLGVAMANPDLLARTGMLVANYQHSVTPNVAVGAELMHQRSAIEQTTLVSLIAKYQANSFRFHATASPVGLHLSYYQYSSPNTQVAVEFQSSVVNSESTVTAGYLMDLPKAGATFRASVDTNWNVVSTVEKKMLPLPCTLTLSALINQSRHRCLFGIGFSLG